MYESIMRLGQFAIAVFSDGITKTTTIAQTTRPTNQRIGVPVVFSLWFTIDNKSFWATDSVGDVFI